MRGFLVVSGLVVCLTGVGCGADDGKLKVYPAHGKVLVKGQPAEGAKVTFYPAVPEVDGKKVPPPNATTEANGEYHLGTYKLDDGAPAGDYKVSVVWLQAPPPNAQGIFDQKDRLGGRYANPEQSKLTAHVEKGGGEIPAFELQ
jgi:hypothetical protein